MRGPPSTESAHLRAPGGEVAKRYEERVDPNSLVPGDEILVRPGERIAVDGTVIEGRAAVDQSAITGESFTRMWAPAAPFLPGPWRWMGCSRFGCAGQAPIPFWDE